MASYEKGSPQKSKIISKESLLIQIEDLKREQYSMQNEYDRLSLLKDKADIELNDLKKKSLDLHYEREQLIKDRLQYAKDAEKFRIEKQQNKYLVLTLLTLIGVCLWKIWV